MFFTKVRFVYVDTDYLKYLHSVDSEVFYEANSSYHLKPHLGILLEQNGKKYVIPLTSAKEKHRKWADVSASWYRIYEIVDITKDPVRKNDILVPIRNQTILQSLDPLSQSHYRQRILSVLDMRKMFPVSDNLYHEIDFKIAPSLSLPEKQRIFLMLKEYDFLLHRIDAIEIKVNKIYNKQILQGKVLKYHCNFKNLESALDRYNSFSL